MNYFNCIFTNIIILSSLLFVIISSNAECNTKQIRLMYLIACTAKRKRGGADFYEVLENEQRKQHQSSGNRFLKALTLGSEDAASSHSELEFEEETMRKAAESLKIDDGGVALGEMTKDDSFHVLSDLLNDDVANNEIRRREISELIDKCCRFSCTATDFIRQC